MARLESLRFQPMAQKRTRGESYYDRMRSGTTVWINPMR